MSVVWALESWSLLTWFLFPCFSCLLGYFGTCFHFSSGKSVRWRLLKRQHILLHRVSSKTPQRKSLSSYKMLVGQTTLVISIFHTSIFGMYSMHAIPPCSFISFVHCHRLQYGTKFTFKFNLKQNEKARKSWKGKLATAINTNLTARFFWLILQMWGRGFCSLTQLLKPWPWLQHTVSHRNSS